MNFISNRRKNMRNSLNPIPNNHTKVTFYNSPKAKIASRDFMGGQKTSINFY